MKFRRGDQRRVVVFAAATVVVVSVLAAPIASRASTRSSGTAVVPGFYVTGVGRVFAHPGYTAVAVDDQHRLHAMTTVLGNNQFPRALAYYVRALRTGRTTRHRLQVHASIHGSPTLVLSGDGTRINTVAVECGGVVTSSTPVGARRLKPLVDAKVGGGLCSNGDTVVRAVRNLVGRQMAIVTASDDGPAPNELNTLFVGVPGHRFHIAATDLPGSNGGSAYAFEGLLGRSVGQLTAVLEKPAVSGDARGGIGLYFSREQSGGRWSDPQLAVTSLPPAGYLDTLTAVPERERGGQYVFAIERARVRHPSSSLRPRYATASIGGTATESQPLAHTKKRDFSVSIAAAGSRLYAALLRPRRVHNGWIEGQVKEEILDRGRWKLLPTGVPSSRVTAEYLVHTPSKPRVAYVVRHTLPAIGVGSDW